MAREERVIEMTTGSLWKNILLFSLPLMLTQVLEAFYRIRQLPQVKKKPSTSEILDWLQALTWGGVDPARVVKEVPYLGVLLKKNEDMDAMRRVWR